MSRLSLLAVVAVMLLAGCSREMTEQQALAEIEKLGGKVGRTLGDRNPGTLSVSLDRTENATKCLMLLKPTKICKLQVSQTKIAPEGLRSLAELISLKQLMIYDVPLTNDDLKSLRNLTQLEQLTIGHTGVTDEGLASIEGMKDLEELYLFERRVTDAGLVHLNGLTKLTRLVLAETQVSDAGLEDLDDLKKLQDLAVAGTKVTDAGVEKLQRVRPELRIISKWPDRSELLEKMKQRR